MAEAGKTVRIESLPMDAVERVRNERRAAIQLLNYWDTLRGGRPFPSEKDIDPEAIADIWDHCYLIQINDLENRMKVDFTYLGAEILKTYREHLTDEDTADIISPRASRLVQNFARVAASQKPILQSGEFVDSRGSTVKFRQCLLPLGDTDARVDAIFGCARLKVYP